MYVEAEAGANLYKGGWSSCAHYFNHVGVLSGSSGGPVEMVCGSPPQVSLPTHSHWDKRKGPY